MIDSSISNKKKYKYTAMNVKGRTYKGIMLAEDEEDLSKSLSEKGMFLVKSKVMSESAVKFLSVQSKVSMLEVTTFCREFSVMIGAGISIMHSLDTLRNQSYSGLFRRTLSIVYNDVRSGMLLSQAMQKHKQVFPELFRSMTYIGEISGSLDKILLELADYYENDSKLRSKALSALTYPLVLIIFTVAVVALLMFYILPIFKATLQSLDVDMPRLTLSVIAFSDFCIEYYREILIVIILLFLTISLLCKIEKVKFYFDFLKFKLPIVHGITINMTAARFARGISTLIASGIPVIDAIDNIGNILGNRYIQMLYRKAQTDVEKGETISSAFAKQGIFPVMLIQMIQVGEQTGALDTTLKQTASYFDDLVDTKLQRTTALLEPILIIIMGFLVGGVILSVFLPILNIYDTIGSDNHEYYALGMKVLSMMKCLLK